MDTNMFADAIGRVCAEHTGLFKLVLPVAVPQEIKTEIVNAINHSGGVGVAVGAGSGEKSPEQAASFRTFEDGNIQKAVVVVGWEGEGRGFKNARAL